MRGLGSCAPLFSLPASECLPHVRRRGPEPKVIHISRENITGIRGPEELSGAALPPLRACSTTDNFRGFARSYPFPVGSNGQATNIGNSRMMTRMRNRMKRAHRITFGMISPFHLINGIVVRALHGRASPTRFMSHGMALRFPPTHCLHLPAHGDHGLARRSIIPHLIFMKYSHP